MNPAEALMGRGLRVLNRVSASPLIDRLFAIFQEFFAGVDRDGHRADHGEARRGGGDAGTAGGPRRREP